MTRRTRHKALKCVPVGCFGERSDSQWHTAERSTPMRFATWPWVYPASSRVRRMAALLTLTDLTGVTLGQIWFDV